jgi:biotin carboxyl carrier protein
VARATKYHLKNLGHKDAAISVLEVQAKGDGRYGVTVDGTLCELECVKLPNGAVSMLIDGVGYAVEFDEKRDEVSVWLRGQFTRFDVADERKLRVRAARGGFAVEGTQVVTAPMPGKIVKVLVKVGDQVTEGQGLVVVEAMKMENELKSPKAGTISQVSTTEGATVENGAALVVVE